MPDCKHIIPTTTATYNSPTTFTSISHFYQDLRSRPSKPFAFCSHRQNHPSKLFTFRSHRAKSLVDELLIKKEDVAQDAFQQGHSHPSPFCRHFGLCPSAVADCPVLVPFDFDVVIIGAGMAGLFAGKTLMQDPNLDFVILESQDRVGGRVHSEEFGNEEGGGTFWVEEGANWLADVPDNPALCFRSRQRVWNRHVSPRFR
jgi:hypothetical protein